MLTTLTFICRAFEILAFLYFANTFAPWLFAFILGVVFGIALTMYDTLLSTRRDAALTEARLELDVANQVARNAFEMGQKSQYEYMMAKERDEQMGVREPERETRLAPPAFLQELEMVQREREEREREEMEDAREGAQEGAEATYHDGHHEVEQATNHHLDEQARRAHGMTNGDVLNSHTAAYDNSPSASMLLEGEDESQVAETADHSPVRMFPHRSGLGRVHEHGGVNGHIDGSGVNGIRE